MYIYAVLYFLEHRPGPIHRLLGRQRKFVDALRKNNAIVRAGAEKIGCQVTDIGNGFLQISYNGAVYYSRSADFHFESLMTGYICGDKEISQSILRSEGIPVPEFVCLPYHGLDQALKFFAKVRCPVVLKPTGGDGGMGVSTSVHTENELVRAFACALAYSKGRIIMERHADGVHYRVTVLDGEVISVVERIPPYVIGDGETTIRELITQRNQAIMDKASPQIVPFPADTATRKCIGQQGFSPRSVPPKGKTVILRDVCNGGEILDVSQIAHKSYHDLAIKAAASVGAKFCGVDLITTSITAPRTEANCVVNEVNSTPALYIVDAPNHTRAIDIGERLALRIVGLAGPTRDSVPPSQSADSVI